jgi:hypothetical protein
VFENDVLAAAASQKPPCRRQRAKSPLVLGQCAIATVPGVDIDDDDAGCSAGCYSEIIRRTIKPAFDDARVPR